MPKVVLTLISDDNTERTLMTGPGLGGVVSLSTFGLNTAEEHLVARALVAATFNFPHDPASVESVAARGVLRAIYDAAPGSVAAIAERRKAFAAANPE